MGCRFFVLMVCLCNGIANAIDRIADHGTLDIPGKDDDGHERIITYIAVAHPCDRFKHIAIRQVGIDDNQVERHPRWQRILKFTMTRKGSDFPKTVTAQRILHETPKFRLGVRNINDSIFQVLGFHIDSTVKIKNEKP